MSDKIDITSTALEKGTEIAKGFIDKLVTPSIEELGLLIRDRVSLWRFSNQIKILNRAKELCEKNNITTKAISPKLLCPYLENASLEDDALLQDKWANLLVNMVDSELNIQNHVFPYILGQLSKDEFLLLERKLQEEKNRVASLNKELEDFLRQKDNSINELEKSINVLSTKRKEITEATGKKYNSEIFDIESDKRRLEGELKSIKSREWAIKQEIHKPCYITEDDLEEFEIVNIIRLGLAKMDYSSSAEKHNLEIPIPMDSNRDKEYVYVDLDVHIETEKVVIITELCKLFIQACTEKNV